MKNKIKIWMAFLTAVVFLASCDSMNDIHEQYIPEGGFIYATRPYMPEVKAGNNRAVVKMYFVSGTNLRKNVIVWNEGADSLVTDIVGLASPIDSLEIELPNMIEGSYILGVYNLDKDNNRSIKIQAIGNVYGEKYKATLLNRSVSRIAKNDTAMVITWNHPRVGDNGVELVYSNAEGVLSTYRVGANELTTYINSWEREGKMEYTTFYLPEANAVDEFSSKTETLIMAK